jgi:hypothetical protein
MMFNVGELNVLAEVDRERPPLDPYEKPSFDEI